MPKIGEPVLTSDVQKFFENTVIDLPESEAMPEFWEPEAPILKITDEEPLVSLKHSRIKTLNCLWEAGWKNALEGSWLRESVAEKLYCIAEGLPERWGLGIFDAWRPLALQSELFKAACEDPEIPEELFAEPSNDPDDIPLAPGSGFDDVTSAARANFLEATP